MEAMRSSTLRKAVIGGFAGVTFCLIYLYMSSGTGMAKGTSKEIHADKINTEGTYQSFYGYTIISPVKNPESYKKYEEFIRNTYPLNMYFSPLPASSYHVTMYDIFTQRRIPKRFMPKSDSVPTDHWQKVLDNLTKDMLAAQEQCEKVTGNIQFVSKKFLTTPGSIQMQGEVTNLEEVTRLRETCTKILKKTASPKTFHMGLAYKFKEVDEKDVEEVSRQVDQLGQLLDSVYDLQQPIVCYFESMEAFYPIVNEQMFRSN